MIPVILISLLVLYFIGKYITASNKDKNNQNTAQFGEGLSGFAKNTGCLIISIVVMVVLAGLFFVFEFLFGGHS